MKNRTKLTIAAALLAGGMMVACGPSDDRQSDSISGDVKGEKKETTQMSASELEFMINECNTALATLQQIIDSADSNPEERFQARRAHKEITKNRQEYQKQLDGLNSKTDTVSFYNANHSR